MIKKLEPSLLAFDLNKFNQTLEEFKQLNIDYIHYDFISYDYVQTESGYIDEYVEKILKMNFKINVHIMSKNPKHYVDIFKKYMVNAITFQHEVLNLDDAISLINYIKDANIKAGIAIKPSTDAKEYNELLLISDLVTVMSVEPGKGGQPFMEESLSNLKYVYDFRKKFNLNYQIEVDGGINISTIDRVWKYADFFVSGSGFLSLNNEQKKEFLNIFNRSISHD